MGQFWQVINIDKFEQLGYWGKLGECLFDGTPDALVTLLDLINIPVQEEVQQHPLNISPESDLTGSWAGDRIICVGDGITDTPDGILSEEELKEFTAHTAEVAHRLAEADSSSDSEHTYSHGHSDFTEHIDLYDVSGQFFNDLSESRRDLYRPYSKNNCVLRNLTKHEYVRATAIDAVYDLIEEIGDVSDGVPWLGEVVLSRISWSSNKSIAMRYDKTEITRGVWAGDRFDIQQVDTVEDEDEDDEKWKDVSDEVAKEVFEIWESEYGDHWHYSDSNES